MTLRNRTDRPRMGEQLVYMTMWVLLFLFPLIHELVDLVKVNDFEWKNIFRWWTGLMPFVLLFSVHNFLLIPRLLFVHRLKTYIVSLVVVVSLFGASQYMIFDMKRSARKTEGVMFKPMRPPVNRHHDLPPRHHDPHNGMPLPVAMDLLLGILMLGFNQGVALLFKSYEDQEVQDELENMRLQVELRYLKAQINPHFFMNMLNNIHAAVDIDPVKAQDMILELSKLMRYVLYEGNGETTTLADEVKFISSYISLMRQRYPSDKVEICFDPPVIPSSTAELPPLLFISFIENAFKHGVSYVKNSRIRISLDEKEGEIYFSCVNTKHKKDQEQKSEGGVGLENVKRRLNLLYHDKYVLKIEDNEEEYNVLLIIPCL